MSKIEIGRFAERLRRSLGMAGVVEVAQELAPEISPVIVVEDNSADQQFLQGVRLCCTGAVQPAVVGVNTLFRFRNPVGSGVLAVFNQVMMSPTVTSTLLCGYGVAQVDLPTAAATGLRDRRWERGTPSSTTIIGSRANNVAIAFSTAIFAVRVSANFPIIYNEPLILLPGETLEMGTTGLNLEIHLGNTWTERALPLLETSQEQ